MPIGMGMSAIAGATAPATGGVSLTIPLISGLLSGLSGIFGGESEKESQLKDLLDKLYANEDYVKSLPFTKDELFNQIFPIIKQLNMGAADVAAGRLGSALGEQNANVGGGQNFADLYVQSLAPVIAEGQQLSAKALQDLVQMYASMDDSAKKRLLTLLGLQVGAVNELPSMSDFQAFIVNTLQGFDIGSKVLGNIDLANYFKNKKF